MLQTKKLKWVVASVAMLLGVQNADAQFTLTGEVRTRTLVDHGALGLATNGDADPGIETRLRSRLYADYTKEKLELRVALQDVRFFGEANTFTPNGNGTALTGIFEAYGKYKFDSGVSLKVGRQTISYDNQRYLGGLDWVEEGRTFDAFTFGYKKGKSTITAPLVHSKQDELTGATNAAALLPFKYAFFPHYNYKADKFNISVLVAPIVEKAGGYTKVTSGVTGDVKLAEKFTLGGSFYHQGGSTKGADLSGLQGELYVTTKALGKTAVTLGAEILTGDDNGVSDKKNSRFSPDFGTNHAFNGYMDQFYVGAAPKAGLIDTYLKTKTKLKEKSALVANLHYFNSATNPISTYGVNNQAYGAELDLVYVLNLGSNTNLNVGYSQYIGTSLMEKYRSGANGAEAFNGWGWVMLTFKPVLFKTEPTPAN